MKHWSRDGLHKQSRKHRSYKGKTLHIVRKIKSVTKGTEDNAVHTIKGYYLHI